MAVAAAGGEAAIMGDRTALFLVVVRFLLLFLISLTIRPSIYLSCVDAGVSV